jgi:hypothetical protein
MSYDRMKAEEKRLRRESRKIVAATKKQDALEDREFGPDFRGDELPAELAQRAPGRGTVRLDQSRPRLSAVLASRHREGLRRVEPGFFGGQPATDGPPDAVGVACPARLR